jgi:hypothetical protein
MIMFHTPRMFHGVGGKALEAITWGSGREVCCVGLALFLL